MYVTPCVQICKISIELKTCTGCGRTIDEIKEWISFWESLNKPKRFNVVELGPGDGSLAKVLIKTFEKFWKAEAYHQNYEKLNPNQAYVKSVSIPRLQKFQRSFPALLKKSN